MTSPERVPAALREKFDTLSQATDAFCDQRLNDEYKTMIRLGLAALSRKRPSPLLKGKDQAWAAGLVHAVGRVNFLFDPAQTPCCKPAEIWAHFGVGASTGQAKSREAQNALGMSQNSSEWTVASNLDKNPLVWMLQVNGLMVDARQLPLDVQEIALARGLIPYIPGRKEDSP